MIKYDFHPGEGRVVWVVLHGFLEKRMFPDRCRIHEHVPTVYPKAPWQNWKVKHAPQVQEVIASIKAEHGFKFVVLGGYSDGATMVHEYVNNDVDVIVHYSGLWKGTKSGKPAVFILNDNDRFGPIRRKTIEAALIHKQELHMLEGTHISGWQHERNSEIVQWAHSFIIPGDGQPDLTH